jgi:hypothetical protein
MASHTRARAIDAAFAKFLRSPEGRRATESELDALCCWQWRPGYVPRPTEIANMLAAMRLGASAAVRQSDYAQKV